MIERTLDMDQRIAPLVEWINRFQGVTAFGSCEGHQGGIGNNLGNGYHVPYVFFSCADPDSVSALRNLLSNIPGLKESWVIRAVDTEKRTFCLTVERHAGFNLISSWQDIESICSVR